MSDFRLVHAQVANSPFFAIIGSVSASKLLASTKICENLPSGSFSFAAKGGPRSELLALRRFACVSEKCSFTY